MKARDRAKLLQAPKAEIDDTTRMVSPGRSSRSVSVAIPQQTGPQFIVIGTGAAGS